MCELTCDKGDFWREVFVDYTRPVKFMGYVFRRTPEDQARRDDKAKRIADAAVRNLRVAEANDKAIFAAFENVPTNVFLHRLHLRANIGDAYRDGDHAELGRIVAEEIRAALQQDARDAAEDDVDEVIERETLTERRAEEAERAHRAMTEGTP